MSGDSFDFKNNFSPLGAAAAQAVPPAVINATGTGGAVDLDGTLACAAVAITGAISGTPSFAVTLTECDTSGGSYTAIPTQISMTLAAANDCQIVNFKRSKRYVKATYTLTGTSSLAFGIMVLGIRREI